MRLFIIVACRNYEDFTSFMRQNFPDYFGVRDIPFIYCTWEDRYKLLTLPRNTPFISISIPSRFQDWLRHRPFRQIVLV